MRPLLGSLPGFLAGLSGCGLVQEAFLDFPCAELALFLLMVLKAVCARPATWGWHFVGNC